MAGAAVNFLAVYMLAVHIPEKCSIGPFAGFVIMTAVAKRFTVAGTFGSISQCRKIQTLATVVAAAAGKCVLSGRDLVKQPHVALGIKRQGALAPCNCLLVTILSCILVSKYDAKNTCRPYQSCFQLVSYQSIKANYFIPAIIYDIVYSGSHFFYSLPVIS